VRVAEQRFRPASATTHAVIRAARTEALQLLAVVRAIEAELPEDDDRPV
jgi:hypothetical protein